jgi:hypothetical protein
MKYGKDVSSENLHVIAVVNQQNGGVLKVREQGPFSIIAYYLETSNLLLEVWGRDHFNKPVVNQ